MSGSLIQPPCATGLVANSGSGSGDVVIRLAFLTATVSGLQAWEKVSRRGWPLSTRAHSAHRSFSSPWISIFFSLSLFFLERQLRGIIRGSSYKKRENRDPLAKLRANNRVAFPAVD